MSKESFSVTKLEKHDTKSTVDKHINGSLTLVWRDWDNIIKNHPKMVYVTSVLPGEIKGPHLHTKRSSYFTCVHGKVVFVIKDNMGKYHEIISDANEPNLIYVPKNVFSAHMNLVKETSRILTLADIAWRPNDEEMKDGNFTDYDWLKWK
ncbi:WxcM-like domain-containing protein [Candidatus Nitrosotenuis sp. DW1]|uniref:WxcM-like domain-containing protein n=1 Tax=Candidatus Nitrosotenuis sp. DW1 TaxID=2259672 RepID=UPI0015C95EA8|nr:WxcM-like domain-containing protein [Candidatus Nitrosotenuis sp. DW1]QLH09698.1 WxcM-like domain-containing protein [Candidatus Nitrosotenuis sp. DW1]